MFLVFFLAGAFELLDAYTVNHAATTIMQQIYAASAAGTGAMLIFAAVVDSWYWNLNRRLKNIELGLSELPRNIAQEIIAALDGRYRPPPAR